MRREKVSPDDRALSEQPQVNARQENEVVATQLQSLQEHVNREPLDVVPPGALIAPPDLYHRALACIGGLAKSATRRDPAAREPVDWDELTKVGRDLASAVSRERLLVEKVLSGRFEASLVGNMVHTSIITVEIGTGLAYGQKELEQVAVAALLHDVGMFQLPEVLLNQSGRWTKRQTGVMRLHPRLGADLLKQMGAPDDWLPAVVAQEHERANGSGYPAGLRVGEIHEFAQIIGLADRFDALLRSRSWRRGLAPYEAVRWILARERDNFSTRILKSLVERFSLYPVGTRVTMNSGHVGVVSKLNHGFPLRPVVTLESRNGRNEISTPATVDLSQSPMDYIVRPLDQRPSYKAARPA